MVLAPSATTSMSATVLGDADLTLLRAYFVKPQAAIAMSFWDDPQMGIVCDRFTGSATARLETPILRDADRVAALIAINPLSQIQHRPPERADHFNSSW